MNDSQSQHDFERILIDSYVSVLSQSDGKQWGLGAECVQRSGGIALSVPFQLEGSLSGTVLLQCALADARLISNILMGLAESDLSAESLASDQKEAVEEFFRQVMGIAETALSSRFGKVTVKPAEARTDAPHQRLIMATAAHEGKSVSVEVAIENSLYDGLLPSVAAACTLTQSQGNLELLMNVELPVLMRFGERQMKLRDILELGSGAVVELNRKETEPIELLLDGKLIARGEVVVVEGNYGFRVFEVAAPKERLQAVPR